MEAPSSDALVPECRRCPPKWWVPFQGGTISGETRRKGVSNTPMSEDSTLSRRGGGGTILPCQGTYTPFSSLSTSYPPSGCCMSSRITPKQTGTGLNPTEKYFRQGPRKNVQARTHPSELNICAPMPRGRGPRLNPVPVGFNAFLVLEGGVIHATARDTSSFFRRGGEQSRGKGLQVFRHVLKCRCRQGERRRVASPAIGGE